MTPKTAAKIKIKAEVEPEPRRTTSGYSPAGAGPADQLAAFLGRRV
jgi:hypothetical protein